MDATNPRIERRCARPAFAHGTNHDFGVDQHNHTMPMSSAPSQEPSQIKEQCLALPDVDMVIVRAAYAEDCGEVPKPYGQ